MAPWPVLKILGWYQQRPQACSGPRSSEEGAPMQQSRRRGPLTARLPVVPMCPKNFGFLPGPRGICSTGVSPLHLGGEHCVTGLAWAARPQARDYKGLFWRPGLPAAPEPLKFGAPSLSQARREDLKEGEWPLARLQPP